MKLLVLDNYDSFTFNLVQIIRQLTGSKVDVFRNDKIALDAVAGYDKILLSPGPGLPSESGILNELIKSYGPTKSILGVCLGEQAIGEVYGATLENLTSVYHGVATECVLTETKSRLFDGLPPRFTIGRYHSWVVSDGNFPADHLEITARDNDGYIMALQHKTYDVQGVQFHPESVLTPDGIPLIRNWLRQ